LSKKEREGSTSERYEVILKVIEGESDFTILTYETTESEWNSMLIGDKFIAKVRKSGTVVSLSPPE